MSEPIKIEMLYGFKCLRPSYSFGWSDPRKLYGFKPGEILEYEGAPPQIMPKPQRPRCDYCGHFTHPEGYKCKSCGAPS